MNNAEIRFWGTREAITDFLDMTRRPGEELDGYDDRHDFEETVIFAECLGEAGETLLAELMKMKEASEAEHEPEVTVRQELVAEDLTMTIAKMEAETDICTDGYPTPETFERWRQDIRDMDAKVKSGEIQIKSIREQFADHGYIFD